MILPSVGFKPAILCFVVGCLIHSANLIVLDSYSHRVYLEGNTNMYKNSLVNYALNHF